MYLLKNKIIRNFSVLSGTNILIQLIGIISSIRMARQLEPAGYGLMNLVTTQAGLFGMIAAFGLRLVIIRNIARRRSDARYYYRMITKIRLFTTIIAIIIAIGYNILSSEKSLSFSLQIAVLISIIIVSTWDSIETVAFGLEKMEASGIINLVFSITWVIALYSTPDRYCTVTTLLYISILNQAIKTLVYFLWFKINTLTYYMNNNSITSFEYKSLIKQSIPYFILAIFTAIQNQIPILFLQFNSTIEQIGIFSLGSRVLSPLQFFLFTLLTALFPMFSRLANENKELFVIRVKSLLNILVTIGCLGCIGFYLFSDDVVYLLYGEDYSDSAKMILIQCWYTVFFIIFSVIGTVLSAFDKQNLLATLSVIYAIIATPIFFFGSKYGATGLSWAFLTAALMNMTYHWIVFRKHLEGYISFIYSAALFTPLVLLISLSTFLTINLSLFFKIVMMVVLCALSGLFLYKFEYKKIIIS
jgi:O-antigen/teichoic acid export membrane protein